MQNPSAPAPGGYGAQPPQKKGLSKGCLIGIIAAVVLAIGAVVLVAAGIFGFYLFNRSGGEVTSSDPTTTTSSNTGASTTGSDDDEAEGPQPTSAQTAAVSGGQTATWEQQEMTWTVPQRWSKQEANSTSFLWRSPGSSDAANLIVNIAPMAADFPAEISINTYYQSFQADKQKYNEVRWLKLGGVKGVMFREASPEDEDGSQRLQWIGYRDYKGQKQYVSVMLATRGKDFARHEDTLYGILYSTDF